MKIRRYNILHTQVAVKWNTLMLVNYCVSSKIVALNLLTFLRRMSMNGVDYICKIYCLFVEYNHKDASRTHRYTYSNNHTLLSR